MTSNPLTNFSAFDFAVVASGVARYALHKFEDITLKNRLVTHDNMYLVNKEFLFEDHFPLVGAAGSIIMAGILGLLLLNENDKILSLKSLIVILPSIFFGNKLPLPFLTGDVVFGLASVNEVEDEMEELHKQKETVFNSKYKKK